MSRAKTNDKTNERTNPLAQFFSKRARCPPATIRAVQVRWWRVMAELATILRTEEVRGATGSGLLDALPGAELEHFPISSPYPLR